MELVDRIHLNPLGGNFEVMEQLSGECGGIAQQRIKVSSGVKDKAVAAEGGAESAEHVVALEQ